MRKIWVLCLTLAFLFWVAPLRSETKVKFEITKIAQHPLLVNFSWRVNIYSDKSWDGCDLKISFLDKSGKEIHLIREVVKLRVGNNEYSGTDICDANTWKHTEKRVATLDCVF